MNRLDYMVHDTIVCSLIGGALLVVPVMIVAGGAFAASRYVLKIGESK